MFCLSEISSSWWTFSWWGLEFFWTWSAGLKHFFWQLHSVKMGRMESLQQLGLSYHMSQVVVLYIVCVLHLHMTHVDVRYILMSMYSIVIRISTVQTRSFVLLHLKSAASFGFRFAAPWEEWQHPWMLYRLNGEGQSLASTSGVCCWLLLPATSSGMTRAKGLVSNAFRGSVWDNKHLKWGAEHWEYQGIWRSGKLPRQLPLTILTYKM